MVSIKPGPSDDTVWIDLGRKQNGKQLFFKANRKYITQLREKKPSDISIEEAVERCLWHGVQAAQRGDPEMIQLLEDAKREG